MDDTWGGETAEGRGGSQRDLQEWCFSKKKKKKKAASQQLLAAEGPASTCTLPH